MKYPKNLSPRELKPCPFCNGNAVYVDSYGCIMCEDIFNRCPVSPSVFGKLDGLDVKWTKLCKSITANKILYTDGK